MPIFTTLSYWWELYLFSKPCQNHFCWRRVSWKNYRVSKKEFRYLIHVMMINKDKNTAFKPVSKRWIVERSISWFDKDRGWGRHCELLTVNLENKVKLSVIKKLMNKIKQALISAANLLRRNIYNGIDSVLRSKKE